MTPGDVAMLMGQWALVSASILMLPIAILWMAISSREERQRQRDYILPPLDGREDVRAE